MTNRRRILVIGAAGQLGWELSRSLIPLGEVVQACRPSRAWPGTVALDLADGAAIRRVLREQRPAVIVNAAAYTAVDQAEAHRALSVAINGVAPGILAEEAKELDALLVHYSTDYVFSGTAKRPYREDQATAPVNEYGRGKLQGEQAIAATGGRHFIVRTSWLYGARGRNFLLSILAAAARGAPLRVVDDQFGSPTWARTVAEGTAQILAQAALMGNDWCAEHSGVYHMTASGACSWHEFARRILSHPGSAPSADVHSVGTADYPTEAKRPAYSVLDCARLRTTFSLDLGPWELQLRRVMEDLRLPEKAAESAS